MRNALGVLNGPAQREHGKNTMGKPLSRPGCCRQSFCCLEKSVDGDGYNEDGYIPQRSIYDTMCINEHIDHGSAQSTITSRGGQDNNFSSNGNLGVGAGACVDMITFEARSRSTTPIPSVGRRLDERVIFDQLKLVEAGQSSRSPGGFGGRSVSPSVSLMSAPEGTSSSSGKRQHQHDSGKRGDNGRQSWKVLTPPKNLEHLELSSGDVMEKNFLNPLYLQHSMTSPLISPFSGSPLSSGCHTPVFLSPVKPLPFQQHSFIFEESPPSQPRHPPPKPPLSQLSVTALQCVQEDLRRIGERDREREKKKEKGVEIEKKREVSHSVGSMSQEENVGVFGFTPRTKALDSAIDNDSPFSPEPTRDTTPLMLDQISPGPAPARAVSPQPMESTWPRRLIVRKRTVRQGGALHNLPILPPLPSLVVLSAMERKNLPRLTPFSEHQGKLVGLVGRVGYSLKEQNLENWRVYSAKKTLQKPEKEGEEGEEPECKSSDGAVSSVKEGDPESKEQEGGAGGGGAEGEEVEEWDIVLSMVNTLWDEGWGDAESYTGSLRHWPLLKPPSGFGGSHPPSSAASELSLLELERRAKEVESEIVAQQCLTDSLRKKASQLTAEQSVLSVRVSEPKQISTQPSLELLAMGCSTGTTKNLKEDGSPDSNLTLESDSSGVFMSNPSQTSQEDNASDGSDRPLTESDLGSNTSLDQDKDEVAFKDWGREESTELQWCYPSLLKSSHCEGNGFEEESPLMKETEMGELQSTSNEGPDNPDLDDGSTPVNQAELKQRNKSVQIISGIDSPLPLSPSRHEIPLNKSGLDSSDLDPFVTTDSFVYLAVSVPPAVSSAQEEHPSLPSLTESTPPTSLSKHLCPNVEESDFLSTDSFVYLAGPECHRLATEGHSSFLSSSKETDSSDDSGSGVDFVLGSMVGDSDWDSDESESGPKAKSKPIKQPTWDLWKELEQEVLSYLFCEEVKPVTEPVTEEVPVPVTEQPRKVTWQFRAAEGSTRQTSKKDTSSSSSSSSSSSHSSTHTEV